MKKILTITFILFLYKIYANQIYSFEVDLSNLKNDRLVVKFIPPKISKDTLIYQFAKIIPGSYQIKNFGMYIKSFQAFDKNGKKLKVKYNKIDNNFTILNAVNLDYILYQVTETWNYKKEKNYVFQPGGSHFEKDYFYFLNNYALFGYFEGYKNLEYEVKYSKIESLYCSSSANVKDISSVCDLISFNNYPSMVDNPVVYSIPDTISYKVKNCNFHISVVSRNNVVTSSDVLNSIKPVITKSLADFFPVFPINDYHFIFFFSGWQDNNIKKYGGAGATEHLKSSLYFFPETKIKSKLDDFLTHVVTHEFLHVVTPLSLRSEKIYNFNFKDPVSSKHLWLYEGVIEYFAYQTLLKDSIISLDDFLMKIRKKTINNSSRPDISLTDLSENIFIYDKIDNFLQIYERGALIAFLLDIRLNELSEGKLNLKKLVFDLNEKYKGTYFSDEDFLNEITELTYPEIGDFISKYIRGSEALPVNQYFEKIGYSFYKEKPDEILSFGRISIGYSNKKDKCYVFKADPYHNLFGLNSKDVILSINGIDLNEENYYDQAHLITSPESNKELKIVILKNGLPIERKAVPRMVKITQINFIEENDNVGSDVLSVRNNVFYN